MSLTVVLGMAKPRPSTPALSAKAAILMVLMPMTWPQLLIRGPPELPEFRAALVWIRFMGRPLTLTFRLMAETMPSVMVPRYSTPRGSPMATTLSPTRRASESPNSALSRFSA